MHSTLFITGLTHDEGAHNLESQETEEPEGGGKEVSS